MRTTVGRKKQAARKAETGFVALRAGPAQVSLGAKHHVTDLVIGPDLATCDEARTCDVVAVRHRSERIVEARIFLGATDVSADVETSPTPYRWRCRRRRFQRQVGGIRRASRAQRQDCHATEKQLFHDV